MSPAVLPGEAEPLAMQGAPAANLSRDASQPDRQTHSSGSSSGIMGANMFAFDPKASQDHDDQSAGSSASFPSPAHHQVSRRASCQLLAQCA